MNELKYKLFQAFTVRACLGISVLKQLKGDTHARKDILLTRECVLSDISTFMCPKLL